MTRNELETELETVVGETASLSKKDFDRLVGALMDYVVDELGVEIEDEEEEDEESE